MRKLPFVLVALVMVGSACDSIPFVGGGGDERTILVDYSHDEYASSFFYNYPKKLSVAPGMKLVFRQTWTGEPHTVTGGTLVDEYASKTINWIDFFLSYEDMLAAGVSVPNPEEGSDEPFADVIETIKKSDEDSADSFLEAYEALVESGSKMPALDELGDITLSELDEIVQPESEAAFSSAPSAFDGEENLAQNVGQPCYLGKGGPPKDTDKPCSEAQKEQPEFDGTMSYYNSGIIPYEGAQGNTFEVTLADDIDPGTYWFYCAVHGALQTTEVEVRRSGAGLPTQGDVSRRARREIDELAEPLRELYERAVRRNRVEITTLEGEDVEIEGPYAGLYNPSLDDHALINEFIPKSLEVDANEPITWRMVNSHTITFGVPEYFPIVEFLDDGTVRQNPKIDPPGGGAKPAPEQEGMGVFKVDGGTYDGTGFWSSGLIGADPYLEYTMRISKPGTYDFACLIHPPMVGKIEVT